MAKTITVHDKQFRLLMPAAEIETAVRRVAEDISRDYEGKELILCPVLTGSYLFVADLTRFMTFDADLAFVRYQSYAGMQSTGTVRSLLPFPERCRGKHVLIVEDIVDSGITMETMLKEVAALEPASVRVCTFLFKPGNFTKSFPIDYIGASIPNDFIVGYGLDYDGRGRTYRDLYILDQDTNPIDQ